LDSPPVWSRGRAADGDHSSADLDGADGMLLSARAAVRSSADAAREHAAGVQGAQGSYNLELERHARQLERKMARGGPSHPPASPLQREGPGRPAPRIAGLGYGIREAELQHPFQESNRGALLCAPNALHAALAAATPPRTADAARPRSPLQANPPPRGAHSPHGGSAWSPTATALRLLHASHAAVRAAPPYASGVHEPPLGLSVLSMSDHAPRPHTHAAAADARAGRAPSSPAMWQRHSAAATSRPRGVAGAVPSGWTASASIDRKGSELVRVALAELAAI
jgi:hypothetical protein